VSAHIRLAGIASAVCALAVAADAFGCGETLRTVDGRAANARFEIAFAIVPAPIVTGALFALDIVVCPRAGVASPTGLAVDAVMPEHRHGMNYRPTVAARGPGAYRAEGLVFHMPGRWDLLFDVDTGAGAERLAATLRLQ
jgi:hypothetical protein